MAPVKFLHRLVRARTAERYPGAPRISAVRVAIREVGPRDGFQNEPEVVSTDDKVRLIELLAASGLRRLEVTSFVRPDVIPQLADGPQVLERISVPDDMSLSVLIPNERGLENALGAARALPRGQRVPVRDGLAQPGEREPVGRGVAERAGAGAWPRAAPRACAARA